MASRAERRRAAAVLFLFAVLPRSLALDLSAVDARARAREGKLRRSEKKRRDELVGSESCTEASVRGLPGRTSSRSAQGKRIRTTLEK